MCHTPSCHPQSPTPQQPSQGILHSQEQAVEPPRMLVNPEAVGVLCPSRKDAVVIHEVSSLTVRGVSHPSHTQSR